MKTMKLIGAILCVAIFFSSCKKDDIADDTNTPATEGLIEFKCINPVASNLKSISNTKSVLSNPALTGDTTETYFNSMKLTIGDVWVSQGEVKAGGTDNLEWIRLTSVTNINPQLFEDYSFPAKEIPVGNYKSVKITYRNVFYRHVRLISDTSVNYELLETMGSWTTPCDAADTTWATTNFFGPDGNHKLNDNDLFELVSSGEKIGGFNIAADKKAIVAWRLYAGVTTSCTNYLIDENSNLQWDCGIDRIEESCPPDLEYMWDFVVEYE